MRIASLVAVGGLLLLSSPAVAEQASNPIWGVRALVVQPAQDLPLEVGAVVNLRVRRGALVPQVGGSFATSPAEGGGGHIRGEVGLGVAAGPIDLGAGGGFGTLSVETPGVGSGKWTGAALVFHAQLGADLQVAGRGLRFELRAAHTLPIGSTDPTESIPDEAARLELSASAGLAFP